MAFPTKLLAGLAVAGVLAASVFPRSSRAETLRGAVPNIVLVHGAFVDGSSWAEVVRRLQRKGYHVTAVQNPLTSLADDVAATRRVLARQRGPVLLVGHSWAGAVITEAGNADNVRGLVYLSALVPDSNESVADLLTRLHAPMDGLTPDADGWLWLDAPTAFRTVMAGDVPMDKVRVLAATQQPIAARAFADRVSHAAWRSKPSWYLVTDKDHALPPTVQRQLAHDIGAQVQHLASSHLSLVSHPQVVADFIDRAARDVAR
ncbi:alpha/beta fold hydrolase [Xanthomonas sacchari]|uniref:Alpha/beta hydrolase n=1 Tax=Xanthomonas sacchari TaxID=56458 RepID=A0A2P5YZE3_9XANT|nr:alpha/beta hydrolase [Xanthomonas sacchari]MDV0439703.1 alpha/beta hydrolase [Xanthomonas sacchari]PPU80251.1 alpha/beta hydrolase [Xanthomonas sacchari]